MSEQSRSNTSEPRPACAHLSLRLRPLVALLDSESIRYFGAALSYYLQLFDRDDTRCIFVRYKELFEVWRPRTRPTRSPALRTTVMTNLSGGGSGSFYERMRIEKVKPDEYRQSIINLK